MASTPQNPPESRREMAKAERRARILKTAVKLVEENGLDGFSMRDLAREAGLSHATPFNLFGTKTEVIAQILESDWIDFRDELAATNSKDAIDLIFGMVAVSIPHLRERSMLYRSLYINVRGTAPDPVFKRVNEPRHVFLKDLVRKAQDDGLLRAELDAAHMGQAVIHQFESALLDWVGGRISLEHMEAEVCFGLAAVLVGFASEHVRDRLVTNMRDYHATLSAIGEGRI